MPPYVFLIEVLKSYLYQKLSRKTAGGSARPPPPPLKSGRVKHDQADINNQKSRKYKGENKMSYLERFSSLLALMPAMRAAFSSFHIKRLQETKLNPVVFVYNSGVP